MRHLELTVDYFRIARALNALEKEILRIHPQAQFAVVHGEDPVGIYLTAYLDTEDPFELLEDRELADILLTIQVDQYLPVYVRTCRHG